MPNISIFETIMLLCFGLAWPANILKSLRSRTTKGKSGFFLAVVLVGYISGITHKLLYSRDIVLILYCINFVMVSIDSILFLHYRKLDRAREQSVGAQAPKAD